MRTAIRRPVARLRPCQLLRMILEWMSRAAERRRQRRALAALNDDQLRDIGINRQEATGEAAKPFWRL